MTRIAAVADAFPEHYYPQERLSQALVSIWRDAPVDPAAIERLHRHTSVRGRHLALPIDEYARPAAWGEMNRNWIRVADELGARAVAGALERAGLRPGSVDALVFVTVTGLATPSIDARVATRLGLPASVARVPIFGLGCVAGAAGLARAADLMKANPGGVVVLLSVELCSLTARLDDHSMANLIATGLFGDGAAAVALVGEGREASGPEVVASRSVLYPGTERIMGWDISEKGFRLILSPEIPGLIRDHLRGDVDGFLADHGLKRSDIGEWMMHTGGPKIFAAIESALELDGDALAPTREVLAAVGNVSSASVLLVLKLTMEQRRPRRGTWGMVLAVGPGFCLEMVLVRW